MNVKTKLLGPALVAAAVSLSACKTVSEPSSAPRAVTEFQQRAAKYNSVLSIPTFETTPDACAKTVADTIAQGNAALDRIGKLKSGEVTFANTIRALDDSGYVSGTVGNRLSLIKETSTNAAVREAATEAIKKLEEWSVGLDYREDVYRAVKAYAATKPALAGEDARLFEMTMRDYKRAGLELPKAERDQVEQMRKDVARLSTDFETNINEARGPIKFTKAQLDGAPDSFLSSKGVKTGPDEYTVMANITFHRLAVLENCKVEATRKQLVTVAENLAREKNVPLLKQILGLKHQIARKLGYASWADYQIEPKMAKNAKTAIDFLENLKTGLQPKFDAEVAELQKLKARDTRDPKAVITYWDWRYYSNELKKEKYTVDTEELRVYFPYDRSLKGMFDIYQRIFGLKFVEIDPQYKWCDDLKLFAVSDSKTGEPLGLFYLDMFPREGKYNHFAQFGIIDGKLLPDGKYQRPTVCLVCNFPPPEKDKPSLLSYDEVETLFHEFGHGLHSIVTRAKYSRFSGTSVPRDFVEAPSQMLERWVKDKKVLDTFAADYRDPSKKIPQSILGKLKEAELSAKGMFYRRQISFGLTDLALHSRYSDDEDVVKISNEITSNAAFPVPEGTAYVGFFGHLMGYDAGYYGYAWADAIAADMATTFEKSKDGFLDVNTGLRLRHEIYEPGDSRDVNESIEKFLGRPRSLEPFLKYIGIGK